MNESFCRVALPAGVFGFALAGLILPMIRHRLRHGEGTGFVIADVSDPVGKAVGVAMTTQSNFVGLYALAFAFLGAQAVDVFPGVPLWLGYAGLVLLCAAIVLIVTAQAQMGRSWRMCIDEGHTQLVTTGLFGVVRNPIYLGTLMLLWGVFLLAPSPWSAGLIFSGTMFVSIQARLEEGHLLRLHGESYREFGARVGRFLPGVGRLAAPEEG